MGFYTDAATAQAEDETPVAMSEGERVLCWRFGQFLSLGFGELESASLAETQVYAGYAERMLRNGCSHQLASRILL